MIINPQLADSGPAYERSGLAHSVALPAAAGPHPTVVMIHGRAGTEAVMWVFARTLPPNWLLVAPRAPLADPNGGYSWHGPLGHGIGPQGWATLADLAPAVERLSAFIDTLPELYGADPHQLYLMGFSQGAALSLALAMHHRGRFQGIAALVGFMPAASERQLASAPFMNLPIFMAAGSRDERIPLTVARQTAEAARTGGAWLEYREYDTGHRLNTAGMRKLQSWWAELDQYR